MNEKLPFSGKNYQWMMIGVAVLILGFIIMASDSDRFGVLGLTVGPLVLLAGFGIELYCLLISPKKK